MLFAGRERIDSTGAGARWSFCRDFGGTRAIFVDSRAGRVLDEGRAMVDDEEWDWIVARTEGDFDHLLIATTVPWLLSPGLAAPRGLEREVCDGATGRSRRGSGEAAPRASTSTTGAAFAAPSSAARLLGEVAAGRARDAPASIVVLSGDVHHAYLTEVDSRRAGGGEEPSTRRSARPSETRSTAKERQVDEGRLRPAASPDRRPRSPAAGAPEPGIGWRLLEGPYFDNQVATLHFDGRDAAMRLEKTLPGELEQRTLEPSFRRRLA